MNKEQNFILQYGYRVMQYSLITKQKQSFTSRIYWKGSRKFPIFRSHFITYPTQINVPGHTAKFTARFQKLWRIFNQKNM